MAKPIKLTDRQKQNLKRDFDKLSPSKLTGDRLRYYNLIKAGKKRYKNSIRLQGRFLSGEIVEIIKQVARKKGLTSKQYIKENETAILSLIEEGYTYVSKDIDKVIDIVSSLNKKTVEVDTGNGIVKMKKFEAIELMSSLQQYVKSTTKVVMLATNVRTYKTGKIRITVPEDYDDYEGQELIDYLDDFDDIFYVES